MGGNILLLGKKQTPACLNSRNKSIAKESEYVEEEKIEGEEIDSVFLLDEILFHIHNALNE